jgi:hypothetical protein
MITKRGFALIFSIFLVVGLEAVMTGGVFNMMRLQREVQRTADEMRLHWAADAVVERAIKLLSDHIGETGGFPDLNMSGASFQGELSSWFSALKNPNSYHETLSDVSISALDIQIIDQSTAPMITEGRTRDYAIKVTAKKMVGSVSTVFEMAVRQEVLMNRSNLFDFSVFCEGDCEITAGPDFELQGPIFSNENIYLMINKDNKLTLKRADDLPGVIDHEPYVMRTADGNIYFYFKRTIGENYFLSNSIYLNSVSDDYKKPDLDGLEIYPGFDSASAMSSHAPLPYFYYFKNGAECANFNLNGVNNCATNKIFVENEELVGPLPNMNPNNVLMQAHWYGNQRLFDTFNKFYATGYGADSLSVSSAFNPADFDKPLVNEPPNLSIYQGAKPLVKEGVERKTLPIEGLIDPLIDDEPSEIYDKKLHNKADTEFILNCSGDGIGASEVRQHFFDRADGVFLKEISVSDTRATSIKYELDIHALAINPDTRLSPTPQVIYFHDCDSNGNESYSLRLINGQKLPKDGFTVISSGRVWIKGNYNTFDYEQNNLSGDVCSPGEWDAKACHVPPAAIFSDSFGVLSEEWEDDWVPVNNGQADPGREERRVTSDVMINTALATGNTPSHLDCNPKFATSTEESGCEPNGDFQSFKTVGNGTLTAGPAPRPDPNYGKLLKEQDINHAYTCPNETYGEGININDPACEYYRDDNAIGVRYHYYVNPKSTMYQTALGESGSTLPYCNPDPSVLPSSADSCTKVRIPIFADPKYGINNFGTITNLSALKPAPPFPGVHFTTLLRYNLTGRTRNIVTTYYNCPGVGRSENPPQYSCDDQPAEGTPLSNCCADGSNPTVTKEITGSYFEPPNLNYYWRDYSPLYIPKYSGGIENLINLQEAWSWKEGPVTSEFKLRFLGTLSVPWESRKTTKDYGVYYYTAPERIFDYNENLRFMNPPGTPDLVSAKRRRWSRS